MPGRSICVDALEDRSTRKARQAANFRECYNLLIGNPQTKRRFVSSMYAPLPVKPTPPVNDCTFRVNLNLTVFEEDDEAKRALPPPTGSRNIVAGAPASPSQGGSRRYWRSASYLDGKIKNKCQGNQSLLAYVRQLENDYASMERELLKARTLGPVMIYRRNQSPQELSQTQNSPMGPLDNSGQHHAKSMNKYSDASPKTITSKKPYKYSGIYPLCSTCYPSRRKDSVKPTNNTTWKRNSLQQPQACQTCLPMEIDMYPTKEFNGQTFGSNGEHSPPSRAPVYQVDYKGILPTAAPWNSPPRKSDSSLQSPPGQFALDNECIRVCQKLFSPLENSGVMNQYPLMVSQQSEYLQNFLCENGPRSPVPPSPITSPLQAGRHAIPYQTTKTSWTGANYDVPRLSFIISNQNSELQEATVFARSAESQIVLSGQIPEESKKITSGHRSLEIQQIILPPNLGEPQLVTPSRNPEESQQVILRKNLEESQQVIPCKNTEESQQVIPCKNTEESQQVIPCKNPEESQQVIPRKNPEEARRIKFFRNPDESQQVISCKNPEEARPVTPCQNPEESQQRSRSPEPRGACVQEVNFGMPEPVDVPISDPMFTICHTSVDTQPCSPRSSPPPRSSVHTACSPSVIPSPPPDPVLNPCGITVQLLRLAVMLYVPNLMPALNALIARQNPGVSLPAPSSCEGTNDMMGQILGLLMNQQTTNDSNNTPAVSPENNLGRTPSNTALLPSTNGTLIASSTESLSQTTPPIMVQQPIETIQQCFKARRGSYPVRPEYNDNKKPNENTNESVGTTKDSKLTGDTLLVESTLSSNKEHCVCNESSVRHSETKLAATSNIPRHSDQTPKEDAQHASDNRKTTLILESKKITNHASEEQNVLPIESKIQNSVDPESQQKTKTAAESAQNYASEPQVAGTVAAMPARTPRRRSFSRSRLTKSKGSRSKSASKECDDQWLTRNVVVATVANEVKSKGKILEKFRKEGEKNPPATTMSKTSKRRKIAEEPSTFPCERVCTPKSSKSFTITKPVPPLENKDLATMTIGQQLQEKYQASDQSSSTSGRHSSVPFSEEQDPFLSLFFPLIVSSLPKEDPRRSKDCKGPCRKRLRSKQDNSESQSDAVADENILENTREPSENRRDDPDERSRQTDGSSSRRNVKQSRKKKKSRKPSYAVYHN